MDTKVVKSQADLELGFIEANISPFEIVQPGSIIELTLPAPVTEQHARSAVALRNGPVQFDARVKLIKKGQVIAIDISNCNCGSHILEVSELLSPVGERVINKFYLPFAIIPISGEVPKNLRIEHATRVKIEEFYTRRLRPGEGGTEEFIDVIKAVDRKTGAPSELAFDEHGKLVDFDELFSQLEERRAEKFGRIDETLYSLLEKSGSKKSITIVVWPPIEILPSPYEKYTERETTEPPEEEYAVLRALQEPIANLKEAMRRVGVKVGNESLGSMKIPYMRGKATTEQIRLLAEDKAVGAIFYDDPHTRINLSSSMAIARTNQAQALGFGGKEVRVAVWENGPSNLTNLHFTARFSNSPPASNHAILVSSIIKNTEPGKPHGHAPDCDLYSANSVDDAALRWALDVNGCTVVNQCFYKIIDATSPRLSADDVMKDWAALF